MSATIDEVEKSLNHGTIGANSTVAEEVSQRTNRNSQFEIIQRTRLEGAIKYKKAKKNFFPKYFELFIDENVWKNFTYDIKELRVQHFDRVNHDKLKPFHLD